ncbi:hypothetical protein AM1_F0027 (plasmid) [Acaryochloris marina MBIC11017]|uniref:Uncharacterized protein n=1 Tax=Acaryochloris marina (strain MBIC 11017) TaxID=329726 RepID=A8ZQ10_ACAM1|nr:hypothetical protein AM1_F0027 [Acaryochloris marina MBIC11017]
MELFNSRAKWMEDYTDHLQTIIVVRSCVKFRTNINGSDSVTCAWFVWQKNWSWKKLGVDCPFQIFTKLEELNDGK